MGLFGLPATAAWRMLRLYSFISENNPVKEIDAEMG